MNESNFFALLEIQISRYMDKEYIPYIEDLIRMMLIQIVIQLMFYAKDPIDHPFLTSTFFELLLYISVGVSVYWLLFKKLVVLS